MLLLDNLTRDFEQQSLRDQLLHLLGGQPLKPVARAGLHGGQARMRGHVAVHQPHGAAAGNPECYQKKSGQ